MSIIAKTIEYLNTKTFIPHKNGNSLLYGLNEIGCDSIIMRSNYNNDIWKFVFFISNTNEAVYINNKGEEFILENNYMEGIIRMQEI